MRSYIFSYTQKTLLGLDLESLDYVPDLLTELPTSSDDNNIPDSVLSSSSVFVITMYLPIGCIWSGSFVFSVLKFSLIMLYYLFSELQPTEQIIKKSFPPRSRPVFFFNFLA